MDFSQGDQQDDPYNLFIGYVDFFVGELFVIISVLSDWFLGMLTKRDGEELSWLVTLLQQA